jgi:uncharacterized membrane protein YbhN (UPF0104 family)
MIRRLARLGRSPWLRLVLVVAALGAVVAAFWWRGPEWDAVGDAFNAVLWEWVFVAIAFNLLSVIARAIAWRTVIGQAMPPPHPRFGLVFSAFSIGLMGNAVLPGRVGELARVAVLTRHMPELRGAWATLVGSVFAHRVFDLVPMVALVIAVLATADLPHWALTSLLIFLAGGAAVMVFALLSARHHHRARLDGLGTARRLVTMARHGLGVMRRPLPAAIAIFFQCLGWTFQLFAVWSAMRAFEIELDFAVAGLVLVLMNVATIIPLWPGNIGLVQAAVALPLVRYGVPYARGFAFGIGLQVIEASVGVGFGLIFLGREGLSFATLRRMPGAAEAEIPEGSSGESPPEEIERARARVPG